VKKRQLTHAEIIRTGTGYIVIHHRAHVGRKRKDGEDPAPDLLMFLTREELMSWLEESLENCD
jgi:hypothetical protein